VNSWLSDNKRRSMKLAQMIKALRFPPSYTPRWVVLLVDLCVVFVSITLAYLIRYNFELPQTDRPYHNLQLIIPLVLVIRTASFVASRTYARVIRYTNASDALRIVLVAVTGSLILVVVNILSYFFITQSFIIPISILVIEFLLTVFFLIFSRLLIQSLYVELSQSAESKSPVAIFGADETGTITKHTLEREAGSRYRVVAFFDDDHSKKGKTLDNIPIHHSDRLRDYLSRYNIEKLVIAKDPGSPVKKQQIIDVCLAFKTAVLSIPDHHSWIDGKLRFSQIKEIDIQDLLDREPIVLDEERIRDQLIGRTILITGAAGSIGSEIARQIVRYKPAKLILLDQSETPLYDLELELIDRYHFHDYEIVIGDVSDETCVGHVFATFRPMIVYHAAAYKHVPMMENNPAEAVKTNVFGTRTLAKMADRYETDQFVMISTDKAVNPISIMGATKRIAEVYIRMLNDRSRTRFVTTRFGNVLGSNGSVIQRFKRQIAEGGPLTLTHPQASRYFMTPSEACQLVLESGSMAGGGEIYLFDMGHSINISDLAGKMIKLFGLEPEKDIKFQYTGLRPGEKIHEELVSDSESPLPTHHEKIQIVKANGRQAGDIEGHMKELMEHCRLSDHASIIEKMKQMVPEFKPAAFHKKTIPQNRGYIKD